VLAFSFSESYNTLVYLEFLPTPGEVSPCLPNPRSHFTVDLPPISPELRLRLKEDISRRGIVVPVVIAQDGECLDGRLRLEIAEELGLPARAVPKIVVGRVSAAERADLRVVLNLCRRQLTQAQIRELIAWELRRQPQASDRGVGKRLGVDHKTVGGVRSRLEGIGEIPRCHARQTSDGRRYPSTRKPIVFTTSNAQVVEAQRLLDELGDEVPETTLNVRKLRSLAAQQRRDEIDADPISKLPARIQIKHCSYDELKLKPASVSLLLTDPPWSQDRDTLLLWEGLAKLASRVLAPGGLLLTYCGQAGLPRWLETLGRHLTYRWQIVCVNEVGHSIAATRGSFGILNGYRCLLLYSKGPFHPHQPLKDTLITGGSEKAHHEWQQPVSEAQYFVERLCAPGGLVCDPFCGSGTVAHAVLLTGGGRRFVGCDINPSAIQKAQRRVAQALKDQSTRVSSSNGVAV
jgi:ParB-like chromosome segregation protein Spo0J